MRIILSGFCSFIILTASITIKNECNNEIKYYEKNDIEIRKVNTSVIGISEKCILKDIKIENFSKEFGLKVIITRDKNCLIRVPDEIIMKSYITYLESRKYSYE